MKKIRLADVIGSFAAKRLTAHQVDPDVSNGHELQGSMALLAMLGPDDRRKMPCVYYWLPGQPGEDLIRVESTISWYDARRRSKRSAEYRLYYSAEAESLIQGRASVGDLAVVALGKDGTVHMMLAEAGSAWERKLTVLFGLPSGEGNLFEVVSVSRDAEVGLAEDMLLEALGVSVPVVEDDLASRLIEELFVSKNGKFPKTKEFSAFARKHFKGPEPLDDPDAAVVAWMEWETTLFRLFEAKLVAERIRQGFNLPDGTPDVESFVEFARSVGNTRFSRAGWAFEHHVGAVLEIFGILHSARCVTEQQKKPDLLFPSIELYHNPGFPAEYLRMLGLKTSLKDRWRQVANEANRIPEKHLLTLEAPISADQMAEMKELSVSLVIPASSHRLFGVRQQGDLLTFRQFIDMVLELQKVAKEKGLLSLPMVAKSGGSGRKYFLKQS